MAFLTLSTFGTANAKLNWTEKDHLFRRTELSKPSLGKDTTLTLWRGERNGLAAKFTADDHTGRLKVRMESVDGAASSVSTEAYFIDNVLTNSWRGCGWPPDTLPAFEVADALVKNTSHEISKGTTRYLWTTIDVPHDIKPGKSMMRMIVSDSYSGMDLDTLGITLEVIDRTLPRPHDQSFFLNFWQQPYAVARYYGVEPWSDEHLELMKPYTRQLARAGQKAVTTILFYEPWGVQSNDKFLPMVETTLGKDGNWKYDYSVFDRYVEFMAENGVDQLIECFSMIPWDMNFRYMDEASGEYRYLQCKTGDREYADLWIPFLKSFEKHLKEKGWIDKTLLAIDERGLADMQNAITVAKTAAPALRFSLAGNFHKEIADDMSVYTLTLGDPFPENVIDERSKNGETSLYYTCCSSPEPNIFSNNAPADAAYIPVSCTAQGADGYLHWAFNNWTDSPLTDTRFFMFAPGDTYCVYPDGGSSLRWERLIEGIHTSEKIRLLKESLKEDVSKTRLLDNALAPFENSEAPDSSQRIRDYDNLLKTIGELQR